MKTSLNDAPRPLLILGQVANAADLALRRILHAKERGQALIVVDYQGTLATLLTERNKGNLLRDPLLWCDLANRRRPSALFRFTRSLGMKAALRGFLEGFVHDGAVAVTKPTMDAVVSLAYLLADQGSVGLAALVQSLRRPETSNLRRHDQTVTAEIDTLIGVMESVLRYPSVWSLSEGNNVVDLASLLKLGATVWIELPYSHFERTEHQVVSQMVDAALADALLSMNAETAPTQAKRHSPIVLYGFPNNRPLPMAFPDLKAKQVGLFSLSPRHPLPSAARKWLEADADCWVAGEIGKPPATTHTDWLDEAERARLGALEAGQVWVRSGASRKAVTALMRPPEAIVSPAQPARRQALKRLHLTPIRQFSTALPRQDQLAQQNADL